MRRGCVEIGMVDDGDRPGGTALWEGGKFRYVRSMEKA